MKNAEEIKRGVKEKYAEIAHQSKESNDASCCGAGGCSTVDYAIFSEDYSKMDGYNEDADLGLGCGVPTEFAQIKAGDTVLDLGSGAGNDCFVARALVGEQGKVVGIDFTDAMINKARLNADKLGFNNVEFRQGDIEQMPIIDHSIDVIISNCVLNLVPNKAKAFSEMYRVLKWDGHFSISDVVMKGEMPEALRNDAEMYAGCVSGAIQLDEYMDLLNKSGFQDLSIQKQKVVQLPDDILSSYLNAEEIKGYKAGTFGIFSITVYGKSPKCDPNGTCC